MASLVLNDSFKKLPDQITYPYAEPDDLQKHLFSSWRIADSQPVLPPAPDMDEQTLRQRFILLESKVERQRQLIRRVEKEYEELTDSAYPRSEWCSQLGNLLAKYICYATDNSDRMVCYIIGVKYTKEFLTIVNSVLRCFLQKYQKDVPPNGSNELDFVKGLLGILGNISKPPAGRDFLATNEFALSLMTQFVMYLPTLPVPSGDSLKKLLLLPLFNMYSRPGLAPPHGWRDLLLAFRHSLQHDKDQTFTFYYLSIVMNLLFHPPSKDFVDEFAEIVPMTSLNELVHSNVRGLAVMAAHVARDVQGLMYPGGKGPWDEGPSHTTTPTQTQATASSVPTACYRPPQGAVLCPSALPCPAELALGGYPRKAC
uniref:Uncharacterized protein n=1 Tax=Timema poppense TaxID=170557 RepID=A0A7R9D472_TIMPO|nr:unnamed protein product [Timema poppensis]